MNEQIQRDVVWVKGLPLGRRRRLIVTVVDHGPRVRDWTVTLRGWRRTWSLDLRRYRSLPGD